MMKQSRFAPDYQASAAQAMRDLKTKALLCALLGRIGAALSKGDRTWSAAFVGGVTPRILIRNEAGEIAGRVTIDAESGLYVFCEFGDSAADLVIATANENRLIEEIALHLCDGHPTRQPIDAAVGMLVGQTIEDVERKLILQTLHHCNGDPTHTAFMLGMPLVTLCNKLAVYFAESASELPQTAADAGLGAEGYRL